MGWECVHTCLSIALCFGLLKILFCDIEVVTAEELKVVSLPNEECGVRPELVHVGESNDHYYPVIVSLHRCGGACGDSQVITKRCTVLTSHDVYVNVYNNISNESERLKLQNHTSCSCDCAHNTSVCVSETQIWDDKQCECVCAQSVAPRNCSQNEIWNPLKCKCECDLTCSVWPKETMLNETSCSCYCHPRYYKRCNRKNKVLKEEDCSCVKPTELASTTTAMCSSLPAKWAAVIIVISFCAFVIVAVDCVLYCKSTGCVYISTHLCLKAKKRNDRLRRQHKTSISDDAVDIVQGKSIKALEEQS